MSHCLQLPKILPTEDVVFYSTSREKKLFKSINAVSVSVIVILVICGPANISKNVDDLVNV